MTDVVRCTLFQDFVTEQFHHISTYLGAVLRSHQPEPGENDSYSRAKTEHIQVGDINIVYKRFGQGKSILLICGASQTKDVWEPTLLSKLASTNHTVIVFDNRGIGETTIGAKPFSIEQFANDTSGLRFRKKWM